MKALGITEDKIKKKIDITRQPLSWVCQSVSAALERVIYQSPGSVCCNETFGRQQDRKALIQCGCVEEGGQRVERNTELVA